MKILGSQESLIEFPGHLSYVIFIAGCNFRCPFCYVPHLVLPEKYEKQEGMEQEKILKEIKERKNFIDAVCITGGEPTIHPQLFAFLKKIKKLNIKVRLETNGSNPEAIEKLMQENLIDSVALDIKNCREKYNKTCGAVVKIEDIEKTVEIIKNSNLDYELRTTLVPGFHNEDDIKKIARWLFKDKRKIKLYVLNQFRTDLPEEKTINPEFIKKGNYPYIKLEKIKTELEKTGYFEKIKIRGEKY